jgi:monofunctional biosynthetic peptidoglycan transglycosylase
MGLTRDYIEYDEMGVNAKLAVICAEDQLFPDHNGFDWNAIQKALKYNSDPKHKKVRGASTISQQTAKNVFYGMEEIGFARDLNCIIRL